MINEHRLAIILGTLKEHPQPNYFLQQYIISPGIAAKALSLIRKDLIRKVVFDLGCGTGRLAIGAALVGAKLAKGFDIDLNVLKIARENVKIVEAKTGLQISNICKFEHLNVFEIKENCDVVLQFPPLDNDYEFFRKAMEISKIVYSFHLNSERVINKIKSLDSKIEILENFNYPIVSVEDGNINRGICLLRWEK